MFPTFILHYEAEIRLGIFITVFCLLLLWEYFCPWRPQKANNWHRKLTNLTLMLLSTLSMRLIFPMLSVSAAIWAAAHNVGLLHYFNSESMLGAISCFIALDLCLYLQHRLLHKVPLLWRVHRIHHLDNHLDATSGVRFHPAEALLSLLIKATAIVALGAPVIIVIVFEIFLNALSLFNHANIQLGIKIEAALRKLIVTPNMHRIHHSTQAVEHSKNFGFNLSIWDKLFNSYLHRAASDDAKLKVGQVTGSDTHQAHSLWAMLCSPFK